MSTLAQLEARVSARLVDASNLIYALATIDEALRAALSDYTQAIGQGVNGSITLAAAGHEVSLTSLTGLIKVQDVWWPYHTSPEDWPPNQVAAFRMWWDAGTPYLLLSGKSAGTPQIGDKVRLWYTKPHTIQSLDGAAATSIFAIHETGIVTGAAGYAALSQNIDRVGTIHVDPGESASLNQWGTERLVEFHDWLAMLAADTQPLSAPDRSSPSA